MTKEQETELISYEIRNQWLERAGLNVGDEIFLCKKDEFFMFRNYDIKIGLMLKNADNGFVFCNMFPDVDSEIKSAEFNLKIIDYEQLYNFLSAFGFIRPEFSNQSLLDISDQERKSLHMIAEMNMPYIETYFMSRPTTLTVVFRKSICGSIKWFIDYFYPLSHSFVIDFLYRQEQLYAIMLAFNRLPIKEYNELMSSVKSSNE